MKIYKKAIQESNLTNVKIVKELALKIDEIRINLANGSRLAIEQIFSILTDKEFKRIRKIVNIEEINKVLVDIAKLVKPAKEEDVGLGVTEREQLIDSILSLNKIDEFVKFGIRIADPRTPPPPIGVALDKPHESSDSGSGSVGSGSGSVGSDSGSDSDSGSGKGKKKKKDKKDKKKTKKRFYKSLKRRKIHTKKK